MAPNPSRIMLWVCLKHGDAVYTATPLQRGAPDCWVEPAHRMVYVSEAVFDEESPVSSGEEQP